jgi:hypothetical protein
METNGQLSPHPPWAALQPVTEALMLNTYEAVLAPDPIQIRRFE